MGDNPLVAFVKKRKALSVSVALILMAAAWGISYYIFLSQGNSTYISKSKEIMRKVSQINGQLEVMTGNTDFLNGNVPRELTSFLDSSSKDILNYQGQFPDLKHTPGYNAQARGINNLLDQESAVFNNITQMAAKPLDFANSKNMEALKASVASIEKLYSQINMSDIQNNSDLFESVYKNLSIFLESSSRNSMTAAYKIAQGDLGGNIIQVIPFAFSDKKYIAVRRTADNDNSSYNVILLQSQGSDYVDIWRNKGNLPVTSGPVTRGDLQTKLFTVQDVDGDGNPDVTYFDQGLGTAGFGSALAIYSVANNTEYSVSVTQTAYYTKGSRQQIQVSDNLKLTENKAVYDWIKNTLTQNQIIMPEVTDEDMLKDPNLAGDLWYRENVDLHGVGTVKIHWYDGDAPNKSTITSEIKDGTMVYRAYFKDGVYAIDTQNNKFYVVYIPENQYDWIESLEIGDNHSLIMHARSSDSKPGVTYKFDTQTQTLSKGQ